jgi:hypothetical protein
MLAGESLSILSAPTCKKFLSAELTDLPHGLTASVRPCAARPPAMRTSRVVEMMLLENYVI